MVVIDDIEDEWTGVIFENRKPMDWYEDVEMGKTISG